MLKHTHVSIRADALVRVSEWREGEPSRLWSSLIRAVFAVLSEAQSGGTGPNLPC